MNLSTRQMRAFLQVARLGNFTRAAEQAHITQAG
jgi:DNA-binding transcriptional LysR family regulator